METVTEVVKNMAGGDGEKYHHQTPSSEKKN